MTPEPQPQRYWITEGDVRDIELKYNAGTKIPRLHNHPCVTHSSAQSAEQVLKKLDRWAIDNDDEFSTKAWIMLREKIAELRSQRGECERGQK
jgi:hypothetical protein